MAIYTVHEPPLSKPEAKRGPETFVFVRDGFYWWAFWLTPVWLLYRRLWLAFVVYIAASVALGFALQWLQVGGFARSLAFIALASLVAMEGGTLIRRKLKWWGWTEAGLSARRNQEFAEQRFFDQWTQELSPAVAAPTPAYAANMSARWSRPQDHGVVGLFPDPGALR
ncbi:hypothetical protein GJW-30_1_04309 [Variibacter gotjawalensis]|uniref:DUF2628 domain-containing protein n=1 Tax=Variibacter gotjawalensis TaxID=1333996 RepID=A0A0S3Q0N8_9BRAD|nr:DUF2628 domain-containing protein [Variibacter gotjawalensis]NIK47588.1 hypothetical protein [Variibacter gotjawalensis]RZS49485.1 uncharacterized protein DUF2628 [Variibacter gotjawalensis]BAT61748.1 hypothetical protein GJW-30_1_04309 [Variibacter gotjawalensis]